MVVLKVSWCGIISPVECAFGLVERPRPLEMATKTPRPAAICRELVIHRALPDLDQLQNFAVRRQAYAISRIRGVLSHCTQLPRICSVDREMLCHSMHIPPAAAGSAARCSLPRVRSQRHVAPPRIHFTPDLLGETISLLLKL